MTRVWFAAALLAPHLALAYRPFDGTDADVAEPNTIELDLGPLQAEHAAGHTTSKGRAIGRCAP